MIRLEVVDGASPGRVYELKGDVAFVGRAPQNEAVLDDGHVSGRHLRIVRGLDGGVTIDGHRPITPDRTDLFQLLDSRGVSLPSGVVLGLADLGTAPAPVKQCEKDTWAHDHDNYLDVCLDMSWYKLPPAQVHVLCGEATQISAPKGVRYPCKPHTVAVTAAQPASAAPHTTPTKSDDGAAPVVLKIEQ